MKSIQQIKEAETRVINGLLYKVDRERQTVKRITNSAQFKYNNSVESLDAQLSSDNTKVLHQFLQTHYPEAKLLNGYVRVNGLKIKYNSHGFKVVDATGDVTNVNKFNNDFPTPEAVLKYLSKDFNPTEEPTNERKEPPAPSIPIIDKEEARIGKLKKMAAVKQLTVDESIKEPSKTRLMTDTAAVINKFIEKKLNYRETASRLRSRLAEPLYKVVMPIFDKFRTKQVNQRLFWKSLNDEIRKYETERDNKIAQNKETKKQTKPPKFEGVPLWEPVQPRYKTEQHVMRYSADNEEVINEITVIEFKTRGASGRLYELAHTLEAYFANVVLHHYPKALALLNKVARGEKEVQGINTFKLGKNYVVDPYEVYTPTLYEHPKDRTEFCRVCRELLAYEGVTTMQDWVYTDEFKKGQKLRVCIPMQGVWEAVVIGTEAGVDLRFEDGTTNKLLKGQTVFLC